MFYVLQDHVERASAAQSKTEYLLYMVSISVRSEYATPRICKFLLNLLKIQHIHVWAAVIRVHFLGMYLLQNSQNGTMNLKCAQRVLPQTLQDVEPAQTGLQYHY